jgi:MFS family permease
MAPFAGVLVDTWNPHRVLLATQTLSFLQSSVMAALTLSNRITIPEIIGLSIFQGFVNAFDMPARQVFIVRIVEDKSELPNAIALNSSMFNAARLLGPSIAGVLIARFGEGVCFSIDAVSYLAVLIALTMVVVDHATKTFDRHVFDEFKDGLSYAWKFTPIRATLLFAAALSITTMPLSTLLPIFAVRLSSLKEGSQTFGFLTAASGTGAIFGSLYLASRRTVVGLDRVMVMAGMMLGAVLIGFAFSGHLSLSLGYMLVSGWAMVIAFASGNTLLQTIVEDDKRGRIMSLFGTAIMGMAPFGSLMAGAVADRYGPIVALIVFGSMALVVGGAMALSLASIRRKIHPILERKGIGVAGVVTTEV